MRRVAYGPNGAWRGRGSVEGKVAPSERAESGPAKFASPQRTQMNAVSRRGTALTSPHEEQAMNTKELRHARQVKLFHRL
jgi:hypothetical protein